MKKLFSLIIIFIALLGLVSCELLLTPPTTDSNDNNQPETPVCFTVTLHFNNGKSEKSFNVEKDKTFITPENPVRKDYIFEGWYADLELTDRYDFSRAVTENINLYASWSRDLADLANDIAKDALDSCLHIENLRYNVGYFGEVTDYEYTYGSGVIFLEKGGYYYCLTNQHVTSSGRYSNSSYVVYDAYGEGVDALLVASDPKYDLAILRFKSSGELSVARFAQTDAKIGALTVSVGNPDGLMNAVTFGNVLQYTPLQNSEGSGIEVAFPIGVHDTPVDHGSSGGPVFAEDLTVVGINFAASANAIGNFNTVYFVPISYVHKFLSIYLYV